MMGGESTLFRQTLMVLVGALLLSHLVSFVVFVLLPVHDTRGTLLSGIAQQLAEPACDTLVPALERSRRLALTRASEAPAVPAGMRTESLLQSQLAQVLGVPDSSVRLAWAEDTDIRINRVAEVAINGQSGRLEEAVFLGDFLFARKWDNYWCVGEVQPTFWARSWKFRVPFSFILLSLAALLPFAWLFARRLSRPMHDFATAADAIGRDEQAPLLQEQGPQEMRIAARALNAMQIRIQQQLREREAMIAAIAHDLRTPLSRIAFRVEAASPAVSESVQRDIEQMNAMISATLEFSREGRHVRGDELIDLNALLRAMAEDEQAIHHDVQFSDQAAAVVVEGDELQLNRLFQNLIDNALNFGGTAHIALRREEGSAIITVADSGPGINPEQIEEMFRPFQRGEPSRNRQTGGVGLGLSITRAIAQRHGGDIQISNRPEGGLLVTVSLPLAAA